MRSRLLVLLCLAVLSVSAGCAALPDDGQPSAAEVKEAAIAKADALDAYAATVHVTLNGTFDRNVTYRVAHSGGRTNATYRQPADIAGMRIVTNESATVQYVPRTNRATVTYGTTPADLFEWMGNLLDGNTTYEGETDANDGFAVEYAVEGENASVRIGAGGGPYQFVTQAETANRTTRVWVDRDRQIPVKARMTYATNNTTSRVTIEVTDVTLDPEFAADRFDPNIPDSATVTTNRIVTTDNITELRTNTTVSLPEPDVPAPYRFEDGMLIGYDNQTTITLTYAKPNNTSLLVTKRVPAADHQLDGEAVTVNGTTVRYTETDDRQLVRWQTESATYTLTGEGRDFLLSVAASLIDGEETSAGAPADAAPPTPTQTTPLMVPQSFSV
ncbi:LolA family protein [Salarchaeum japonicum]|uniref:LolA family protein n=1 Tax=Salarchaeum japonicum TaxID=555573 RepID=UPI003C792AAF